jgi:beta-N-acetylhexosaminidase
MKKIILLIILNTNTLYGLPPHFYTHDGWAEQMLQQLSLREKIGQLFMVAAAANTTQQEESLASQIINSPYNLKHEYVTQLVRDYHIGGIIFLYKGMPEEQINLTNQLQQMSNLPLLIGQDCEWGLSMHLYDTIRFPRNMTLGALQDPSLIYEVGREIGDQCKAIGVHINFAPVIDINTNSKNPVISDRSFGQDKQKVADYGMLFMKGMQDAGILACAKHFPGHGDTATDSHLDLPTIMKSKRQLFNEEIYPFKKLIDVHVAAVMTAHLQLPALDKSGMPSSLSPRIVTNLLKKELGFNGLLVTDGLGMQAITDNYEPGDIELHAFIAGNDILLCPLDVPKAVTLIEQSVLDGRVSEEELNNHVLKILRAKEYLFKDQPPFVDLQEALQTIANKNARSLKHELFSQAITIVKNSSNLIPLGSDKLNTMAIIQIGGYLPSNFETTLQKETGLTTHHCPAYPNYEQLKYLMQSTDGKETIIIALFDINHKAKNFGISNKTRKLIKKLRTQDKKIVLVLFGNPYSLSLFGKEDAILMAFEDDSDAQQAAAEVISGKLHPRGELPITI